MAAIADNKTRKITLDLEEGTQTISPILSTASDDAVYATGDAISNLLAKRTDAILLVETEEIIEE